MNKKHLLKAGLFLALSILGTSANATTLGRGNDAAVPDSASEAVLAQQLGPATAIPAATAADTAKFKSLKAYLKSGKFNGHARSYFMATDNAGDFPSYHALALGIGLGYQSAVFHGFQVGMSGFFIYNAGSSALGTDPETGLNSRSEIGLFDALDPEDRRELGRLETFYLRYNYKKSAATFGRQKIVTPFINPEDGRMRPTLVNALWLEVNELEKLTFQGGWIFGMGPRSTQDWFSVEKSIGSVPVGRSPLGGPSQYKGNISSKGVGVGSLSFKPFAALKTNLWHYYADNLFNFTFSQTDVALPVSSQSLNSVILGLQGGFQRASGTGGNSDPAKAYISNEANTWLYSGRIGFKTPFISTTLNYTRIADQGRFIFPREWGVETFYTFIPRERLEGTAGTTAVSVIADINLAKKWTGRVGYGLTNMPDVKDVAKNKYGMPSYSQLQLMTNYAFSNWLDGLTLQALYVYKGNRGETYNTPNFIVNKVNMSQYNFVMNYTF